MTALIPRIFAAILLIFSPIVFAKNYGSTLCKDLRFECYTVKRGDTWDKLFPDHEKKDLVMRINRMNTKLYTGLKIAIPQATEGSLMDYAPLPTRIDPSGEKTIIVSIKDLAFGAYTSEGTLEKWGPISAARGYCPDVGRNCHTKTGIFSIYNKEGRGCASTRYPIGRGGAPMPYCMFFNGNFALHGSHDVPGYNASHGCVRMFIDDAKWLNEDFTAGDGKVKVIVQ